MTRRILPPRTENARRLRRRMTEAEAVVWSELRRRHLHCRFRRQHVIGPFIVDFVSRRHRLIIELDGSQHFESRYDAARTEWLEARGYTVMRFWNNEVLGNLEMVMSTIASHTSPLSPTSEASGGRGPRAGAPAEAWGRGEVPNK